MRVRQTDAGGEVLEYDSCFQNHALQSSHIRFIIKESTAEHHVQIIVIESADHVLHILGAMLSVRVKGDEETRLRIMPERKGQTGLQRRSLSQIDRVSQHDGSGVQRDVTGPIGTAIIDTDDVWKCLDRLGDHLPDDWPFVV
ncbi:hypothetical protein GCM10022230_13370 [Pseudoclavibacter caeni]